MMDSLSYVEDCAPEDLRAAERLVEEELRASSKPPPPLPDLRPGRLGDVMAAELARVERGEELQPLSIERYSCEPPEADSGADAWKAARDNVRAQLEHQANRVVNLELCESFSEHAWQHCSTSSSAR